MPPNQPGQQNQYDFFMSPQSPKRGFNFGPPNKAVRAAIVAGGFMLLIIIVLVISSFFSGSGSAQKQQLIEVAQAQNEIIRISTLGKEKTKDLTVSNYLASTRLSVESSQAQVKSLLNKRGMKTKEINKKLSASKNSKTDEQLTEASQNNRYDETIKEILDKQLNDYQKLMQSTYSGSTKSEKQVLQTAFDSNGRLLIK